MTVMAEPLPDEFVELARLVDEVEASSLELRRRAECWLESVEVKAAQEAGHVAQQPTTPERSGAHLTACRDWRETRATYFVQAKSHAPRGVWQSIAREGNPEVAAAMADLVGTAVGSFPAGGSVGRYVAFSDMSNEEAQKALRQTEERGDDYAQALRDAALASLGL